MAKQTRRGNYSGRGCGYSASGSSSSAEAFIGAFTIGLFLVVFVKKMAR